MLVLYDTGVVITAYGEPAAQGSKRHVGQGRLIEQSQKVAPWRAAVTKAAIEKIRTVPGWVGPFAGPVGVDATFTVPKPKSRPKKRKTWPSTKPDVDKMLRALFDALTDAKVWEDDGRVIEVSGRKVYPGEHSKALDRPGVVVQIWPIGGAR